METEARPAHRGAGGWIRRHWVWLLGICVLRAAAYLFYRYPPVAPPAAAKKKGGDPASRVTPVVADPVRSGEIKIYLNGLGTVTPLRTVTVRSRVDGELQRVHFTEGQLVKVGGAPRRDRPAAVPGAAHAGRRHDGARPRAAGERAHRPRALPDAAQAGLDRRAAGGEPGIPGAAVRRHGQGRPVGRSTTRGSSSPTRG